MIRVIGGVFAAMAAAVWWPWPAAGSDPVVDLIAMQSPVLHGALRGWHYAAPGVALVGLWSLTLAVWRVWVAQARGHAATRGALPPWPLRGTEAEPSLVVGEIHHPVRVEESGNPDWLVLPAKGLFTGIAIFGAVGSGKTSACMRPFARQLLSWRADDTSARAAGLVLEVKGNFCRDIKTILEEAGRGEDYVELGIGGRWQWNPLSAYWLDSYSLAYTVASLINQLFGKGSDPFWQTAYVNVMRWIIELHRMRGEGWVTLRDVYRCMLDAERLEKLLDTVEKDVTPARRVRVRSTDVALHAVKLEGVEWKKVEGLVEAADTEELRGVLEKCQIEFEVVVENVDPRIEERVAAIRTWYDGDWLAMDPKLRTTIVEGLSVFLAMFDLPEVAQVFCPDEPAPPVDDEEDAPPHAAVGSVVRQVPPLKALIEEGKVVALHMPGGTNPQLARAVGVMLKQAWLQALLLRPAEREERPGWTPRPAVFLCDEYQSFATVGESDPGGDEKAFALTRECRVIPIVATQSISSLRAVFGQSEAWRALLQTLRTRIFLSLSDDSSAQLASSMCGQVPRMKASYTVSEQTSRASASLLSGEAGGGTGSVGASKAFSEHREAVFHPRDFAILENCQAIVIPYDGRRAMDAIRCYLKPDFLPRDRPYWRAREAEEL